ncbi:MAG: hypothetical protein LV481_06015 [Methylacidiphilales bacterium]|nr:hypothetical protein [Candidatus Methylacidiphilales bacterium]
MTHPPDHSVLSSIAVLGRYMHHDYNLVCAVPSACMMALFGGSRLCDIVSNVVFLLIPSVTFCVWFLIKVPQTTWPHAVWSVLAFLALLLVPLPWIVTLNGLTDVGGLIVAAVATDLFIRTDIRSRDVIRWLSIGAALAILALCKRWYLYLDVGLLVVLLVEIALDFIATSRRSRSVTLVSVYQAAYGPFFCAWGLVGVYFLSFPLPVEILTTNYSRIYTSYQTNGSWLATLGTNFVALFRYFGLAQVALALLCFVVALFLTQARRGALYLYLPGWVAWLFFSRVAEMGIHHILLFYIATAVMPLFLARQLLSSPGLPDRKPWGWVLLVVAVLVSGLSFWSVFSPSPPLGSSLAQAAFPVVRRQPVQRHDLGEIEALVRFIGDKVGSPPGVPPARDVYVLASSDLFNSSLLSSAGFQLNESLPAQDHVCITKDVDVRDGFPDQLVSARLVLVTDPIQTDLPSRQKVMTVPARLFLRGEGFAHAFTRDPRIFQLDQGVRVYVFERVRPSTPEEIMQLHEQLGL